MKLSASWNRYVSISIFFGFPGQFAPRTCRVAFPERSAIAITFRARNLTMGKHKLHGKALGRKFNFNEAHQSFPLRGKAACCGWVGLLNFRTSITISPIFRWSTFSRGVAIEQHYAACPTVLNYFCGELWRRRAQRGYHIQDIFDLDSFVFRKNHFALHFICFSWAAGWEYEYEYECECECRLCR